MPKGETSRPYNRKQKEAIKTIKNTREASKDFSPLNKAAIEVGKTMRDAKDARRSIGGKQRVRDLANKTGKSFGVTSAAVSVAKRRERSGTTGKKKSKTPHIQMTTTKK